MRVESPSGAVQSVPAPPLAGDELDVGGIWSAVARRKKLIAGVTALGFCAALAFVMIVKPSYTGDARVLIENQESYFTQPDRSTASMAAPDSEAIASQEQLIASRDLGREAIRKLSLKGNPEFDPMAAGQGTVSRIMMLLGLKSSMGKLASEDRILENYQKHLTVFALPKSRVVSILFTARNAKLAARGANTIADLYIDTQRKAKKERARVAAISLGELIADLRRKLAVAENNVEAFRAQTGLLVGANNALLPSQQLAEINAQLATARNAMAEAQAKARLIRQALTSGRLGEVSDISKDEVVRRIAIQRATLRSQIASDSRTLGPAHPRMKELQAQLASVETELRNAGIKVARALENDSKIASVRVENLQAAIGNQQQKVGATSGDQVKLREYELEAKLVRSQLETNLNKYREAVARQHAISTPGDARIISRAVEPRKPSFPKTLPILMFATFAALVLSLAWVVAGELLSGRAFVPAINPVSAGSAPVAVEPVVETAAGVRTPAQESVGAEPPEVPAEAVLPAAGRRLLEKIKTLDVEGYGRRLLICPASGNADHAVAIEPVARALAAGRRVVVVDLSGRIETGVAGFAELLEGLSTFGEVIDRDPGSRLHVIARGWSDPQVGGAFDDAIDALSQTYDFVIIVAPDSDDAAVARQLAPAADLAIIAAPAAAPGGQAVALRNALLESGAGDVAIWRAQGEQEADGAEDIADAA